MNSSDSETRPDVQEKKGNNKKPVKRFIISQYSCGGIMAFNEKDYSDRGRPRCYGIEKRLIRSVELQGKIRLMRSRDGVLVPAPDDKFFGTFRKNIRKVLASNGAFSMGDDKNSTNSYYNDIEKFRYLCFGRSKYTLLEFPGRPEKDSITLHPPKCVSTLGMTIRNQNEDTFFSIQIAGLDISNDISFADPEMRKEYEEYNEWRKKNIAANQHSNDAPSFEFDAQKVLVSKTINNMKTIGNALYTEITDDFFGRMKNSSQRIVGQFGKTAALWKDSAIGILDWLQDDDDDEM